MPPIELHSLSELDKEIAVAERLAAFLHTVAQALEQRFLTAEQALRVVAAYGDPD